MEHESRKTFESKETPDAGEELTCVAQELRDQNPKLTFERALERAMELHPDLAEQHINFDRYQ